MATPKLLTAYQAAELLLLSPKTIYRLVETHQLAGFKIGRSVRVHAAAVNALLGETPAGQLPFPNIQDAPRKKGGKAAD